MSVDQATVRRVAKLARLRINNEDVPKLEQELNTILHWIAQLNEVDVTDVAPLTSVVSMPLKMREDKITEGQNAQAVLANAPVTEDDCFLVPKVIE